MQDLEMSGLVVGALASQIGDWIDAGKLDEADLDGVLTSTARTLVESSAESIEWVPLEDAEALVRIVAAQLGDSTGLVDWAARIAARASQDRGLASLLDAGRGLVDGTGFVVAQASSRVIRNADWSFEGGRDRFSVRIRGLESASPELRTLLGALLSRWAEGITKGFDDLRFEGVDASDLCVFGERCGVASTDAASESRLHRAALVA